MKNPIIAVLCTLLLLSSCGVSNSVTSNNFLQKRKYTNGWNINNLRNQLSGSSKLSDDKITEIAVTDKKAADDISSLTKKQLESSLSSNEINDLYKLDKEEEFYENALCDSIILNNGKIIKATILTTTDTTVSYKSCESDDPTEKTMAKDDIKALQYANGKFEFIPHKRVSPQPKVVEVKPEISREMKKQILKENRKAWRSEHKVLFIILVVLLSIPALILLTYIVLILLVMIFGIGI